MITYDKLNFFNVSNTGDGDSSVLKRLRIAKPYGSDIMIKKVECTNHLLINYINKLRDIANKRKIPTVIAYQDVLGYYKK